MKHVHKPVSEQLGDLEELIDLGQAGCMSEWERDFVRKMNMQYRRTFQLSPKQEDKIEQIHGKVLKEDE